MLRARKRYAFDVEAVTSSGLRVVGTKTYRWRWLAVLEHFALEACPIPVPGVALLPGPVYEVWV